jgi:hypothetical protein
MCAWIFLYSYTFSNTAKCKPACTYVSIGKFRHRKNHNGLRRFSLFETKNVKLRQNSDLSFSYNMKYEYIKSQSSANSPPTKQVYKKLDCCGSFGCKYYLKADYLLSNSVTLSVLFVKISFCKFFCNVGFLKNLFECFYNCCNL